MNLSKSDYLLFLKHPAWLWLKKHDEQKLVSGSDTLQTTFDEGYLFESYAQQLFPGGVNIGFTDYDEYLTQPLRTKKALDGGVITLFQSRFEADHITCICDVVVKNADNSIDLYEIKSSTEAKVIHEYDLAFQVVVLEESGYTVRNINVLCVNAEYVKEGEINPKQLVLEQDVTNAVKNLREITKTQIAQACTVIASTTIPDISPVHCKFQCLKEWLEIYRSLTTIPEGSIYDLCRLNVDLIEKLCTRKIATIADIPDEIELKPQQSLQVKAVKAQKAIIEVDKIRDFCKLLSYPLYFLDYETLSSVIPIFDGTKPYQQVPFQYSLHVLENRESELQHFGYLHTANSHPVPSLTESLKAHIGTTGTVLVWFEGFEKSRNEEMGILFPEFKQFYHDLNMRMVDLMAPFANGWYAHSGFLGSASIKKVLPILVPELSYAALDVHDGATAQRIWMETVLDGKHHNNRNKILQDLDTYCTLDTLAMVRIYEHLENI